MKNETLVIKYAPNSLDDAILSDQIRTQFDDYIKKQTIPHMIFIGGAGIGKTTCANLVAKALNADVLFVPASLSNSIDNVRNRIRSFTESLSIDGNIKIVILDEADGLTAQAQEALRNLIDSSQSDTRFIITGNSLHKIIEPIRSRGQFIDLTFTIKQLAIYVKQILDKESVEYDNDSLSNLIKTIQKRVYPDIRATLNYVDSCIVDNILVIKDFHSSDILKDSAEYIFNEIAKGTSVFNIRKTLVSRQNEIGDNWEELSGEIFDYVADVVSDHIEFSKVGRILKIIAIFITRINRVEVNKDIQFYALILEIHNTLFPEDN